jgi:predicted transposase/invertase (TIGR01784 family)
MAKSRKRIHILNDFAFVKAFGEKGDEPQLISLLNAVLKSADRKPVTSVEIIETKELPADITGGKAAKLDTRAIIYDGTRTNIEIQIKNEYNMAERSLRYWGLEYTRGLVEGQDYIEQPAVIVINLLDFSYIKLKEWHTVFRIYEMFHREYMLTDLFEMHFIEIPKWRKLNVTDLSDPLDRWMAYFDRRSPKGLVEEAVKMDPAIQVVQEKMEMIAGDPALLHAYDMFEMARIDYKMGIQGARQDGEKEGRKEGRKEGILEIAMKMKTRNATLEQIADYTGLSYDEIAKL